MNAFHQARSIGCLLAAGAVSACGADGGGADSASNEGKHLYLTATWVTDDQSTNTYVSVFDSLDIDEVDLGKATEVPGFGDAWVHDEWVFISNGDKPSLGRYTLGTDGKLKRDRGLDFSNYGVTGAAFWDDQILSRTKAYLSNGGGREYIVWNPSTMEITGTLKWPELTFAEGLEPYHSYTDRGGVVVGKYFFHGIYGHDPDFIEFGDKSFVVVWDIETDQVAKIIEVPCPMMDVASLGDDGYLYVSGWSYMPLSVTAGYTQKNCAARIDVESQKLDAGWTLDYAAVTDGKQGEALRAVSGDAGIFAVFLGTGVPVVEGMDMWELDKGLDDWELYSIDLASKEVVPTGVTMSDGSYYESHVGERYFVYLGSNDDDTRVFERTASGAYEPRFRALGWMSRLFQLR